MTFATNERASDIFNRAQAADRLRRLTDFK